MNVPKEIEKYILKDEFVEKEFHLKKGYSLYASNRRLFIKKGNMIRDIDYPHISSIELKENRNKLYIILGLLLIALGAFVLWNISNMLSFTNQFIGWLLIVEGGLMFAFGLYKRQNIVLCVVGVAMPIPLEGNRQELDSLFRLVREKRV